MNQLIHFIGMAGTGSGGEQPNAIMQFQPLLAIIAVMYFFLMRPQAKKQKEHKLMLEALEKGDKVLTAGGLVGTIAAIKEKENTVLVKLAETLKVEVARASIAQVLKKKSEPGQ